MRGSYEDCHVTCSDGADVTAFRILIPRVPRSSGLRPRKLQLAKEVANVIVIRRRAC